MAQEAVRGCPRVLVKEDPRESAVWPVQGGQSTWGQVGRLQEKAL